jgi:hypothetical protein
MHWLFFFVPGLHLDVGSCEGFERYQSAAAHYAHQMFVEVGAQDQFEGPLRTDRDAWSPLIEAELHELPSARAVRLIHRMVYRPGREIIMGHLLIPCATGLFEARMIAKDDTTGYRESTLMLMSGAVSGGEKTIPPQAFFDAREYDAKFAMHSLSRVRGALGWLASEGLSDVRAVESRANLEVELPALGAAITPPQGFVHDPNASRPNFECFSRVSFCATDGIEQLVVESESNHSLEPGALRSLAERRTLEIHREAEVADIAIEVREQTGQSGTPEVVVVVEGQGYQGSLRNIVLWFLDANNRPRRVTLATKRAVPSEGMIDELRASAASWRVVESKPWWKLW